MICKINRHNPSLLVVVVVLCVIACHIYETSGFYYTHRRSGFSPDILRRQKSIFVERRTKSTLKRRRSAATMGAVDHTTLFVSDESLPHKAKTRQKSIFRTIIEKKKKILLIPPALAVVVLFLPRLLKRQLLPSKVLNYRHLTKQLKWNKIARLSFAVLFVSSIFSTINTRRRQSIDPTSEWSRYARRPGARGRAILWLFVKQAFMISTARIVDSIGTDEIAARLRQNAGREFSNSILKLGPLYIKVRFSLYI